MKPINKIVIPLKGIPTLNEHDNENRGNRFGGAKMKKNATHICKVYVKDAMNKGFKLEKLPANLRFTWYAKNKRKDKDNIDFAKKYIFDGMVDAGLIDNDGWKQIGDWLETFEVDKDFERVEITEIKE